MSKTEFNKSNYSKLLADGYKYIEIRATGREIETSQDYFRKEIIVIPHKTEPVTDNYVLPINDDEVLDMAEGTDTDIFYLQD